MGRFHLELIERDGYSKRTAIKAEDYEELAQKIAAKTGVRIDPDDELLLPDGGEE